MALPPGRSESEPSGDLRARMLPFAPALRRYFLKRVGATDAEDLVQDVFAKMLVRGEADSIESIERYLFRIAGTVLTDRHRAARPTVRLDEEGYGWAAAPTEDPSPERVLMARQALQRVIVAMQALPPKTRAAFMLHRFEELTYVAIARRLGCSPSAVDKLIMRALERLIAAAEGRP